jgi:hypothetical protein
LKKTSRILEESELFEWIYDYRRRIQYLEREYLDLRVRLRNAEAGLRSDTENRELQAQIEYLKSRLKDLESRYPWISTGRPSEIPFWILPAG